VARLWETDEAEREDFEPIEPIEDEYSEYSDMSMDERSDTPDEWSDTPDERSGTPDNGVAKPGKKGESNTLDVRKRAAKKRANEMERKAKLEADEWATDVQPTSVKCVGCEKEIRLDKRSMYYPGLWTKHRGKCPEIKRLEAIRDEVSLCARNVSHKALG